jgi:xanthine dehydrogenase YagR molybdenum-binding subunit
MPWPEKRVYIGSHAKRVDGPAKVTGAAKYPSDVQPDGWLYGMILRSKWPAAKITKINLDKARKIPGIKAVVLRDDREERTVRYYGEEIAGVAGTTKQACLDALKAIEIEATPLPFAVKEEKAREESSPRVWDERPNLSNPNRNERGENVDKAFSESAAVVEGFYTTSVVIHHPLETHGNTISWKEDGVMCWASTQGISGVRGDIATNLQIPQSQDHVLSEFMGGGFGAKNGLGQEGGLALRLSREAKAPVKLMLTRFDQALAVGNRPSSFQKIKLGASADGKLTAFEMDAYGTPGFAAGGNSAAGSGNFTLPMPYIYSVPAARVSLSSVAINAGSARAFRAPNHPPASFGMESIMDELAVKLNMDPVEFRVLNNKPLNPNANDAPVREIREKQFLLGAEKFGWKGKYKKPGSSPGTIKTGIGCAAATWPGGSRGGTGAEAEISPDGSVKVRCGTQDLGTGTKTLMALIAADVFGLKPEQIQVALGNTDFPPSGGSGGSTTAASVSPAIFDACSKALEQLQQQSGVADARGENWMGACKKLGMNPLVVQGRWQQGLSSSGAAGVQFAEVAVDTETGFVKVKKILAVHDCGLVVSKLTCESQINGGIIGGIGLALYESRVMDAATGVLLNPNFETYKLPGIADVPDIEIILLDMPERGVIGIGEPATIPTAAAVANAVANALGVRVNSLPITPQKVLAALGKDKLSAV